MVKITLFLEDKNTSTSLVNYKAFKTAECDEYEDFDFTGIEACEPIYQLEQRRFTDYKSQFKLAI